MSSLLLESEGLLIFWIFILKVDSGLDEATISPPFSLMFGAAPELVVLLKTKLYQKLVFHKYLVKFGLCTLWDIVNIKVNQFDLAKILSEFEKRFSEFVL